MKEKQAVTRQNRDRYRRASKKEKKVILNEFMQTTGYANRKYAIRILNRHDVTEVLTAVDGIPVKCKPAKRERPKNRKGKRIYNDEVIVRLRKLWAFYWYKCGKYLAPIIREQMPFLEIHRKPNFYITPPVKEKLLTISPATIDRLLKADKDALRGKGLSGTRLGEAALMRRIPVRTHYSDTERNTPGFMQIDTVHHCNDRDSGEFLLTLTATDVASAWTELAALPNKAHTWALQSMQTLQTSLPFPLLELHSDNGSEFVNRNTVNWRDITKTLLLTRSRPRHKNDNCFAEQKNGAVVRNYVGFARFDTPEEYAALQRVYRSLCPLLNFFIPSKKLLSKTSRGSKTIKRYDRPTTPFLRLMDSAHLSQEAKERLSERRALLNPVDLQYAVHTAVKELLAVHKAKVTFSK
jgi:hypothetical protein